MFNDFETLNLETQKRLLAEAKSKQNLIEQVKLLNSIGVFFFENKNFTDALSVFYEGIDLLRSCKHARSGDIYSNMGELQLELQNFREARFFFEKAIRFFQCSKNTEAEASSIIKLAKVCREENNLSEAIEHYSRAASLLSIVKNSEKLRLEVLLLLGKTKQEFNDSLESALTFSEAFRLAKSLNDSQSEALALLGKGIALFDMSLPSLAAVYFKSALKRAENLKVRESINSSILRLYKSYNLIENSEVFLEIKNCLAKPFTLN